MRFRLTTALLSIVFVSFLLGSSSCDASCFIHELRAADEVSPDAAQAVQGLSRAPQEETDAHCAHFAKPDGDTQTAFNATASPCTHNVCIQNWLSRAKFGIGDRLQGASFVPGMAVATLSRGFAEGNSPAMLGSPPTCPASYESAVLNLRI